MVQFKVYFYSANCTSILLSVLVHYWYSEGCTITVQTVLLNSRVYYYCCCSLNDTRMLLDSFLYFECKFTNWKRLFSIESFGSSIWIRSEKLLVETVLSFFKKDFKNFCHSLRNKGWCSSYRFRTTYCVHHQRLKVLGIHYIVFQILHYLIEKGARYS